MTVLVPFDTESQKDGQPGDWDFCGLADLVAAGKTMGKTFTLPDVVGYFWSQKWDASHGSNAQQIQQAAQHFGVPCHHVVGSLVPLIDAALGRGHAISPLIRSDGWGNPAGLDPTNANRADHWCVCWGHDSASFYIMNSLGEDSPGHPHWGENHVYSAATFASVLEGEAIEWDFTYGAAAPPLPEDAMDRFAYRALLEVVYRLLAGRPPTTQELDDHCAGALTLAGKYEWDMDNILGTPGFAASLTAIRHAAGLQ